MSKVRRSMIVTAAIAPLARQLAAALPAGLGMFVAGYSQTGALPATHYVSDGYIESEFAAALTSPDVLVAMLAQYGQQLSIEDAKALLLQAAVSELPASVVVTEMGLEPVVL